MTGVIIVTLSTLSYSMHCYAPFFPLVERARLEFVEQH